MDGIGNKRSGEVGDMEGEVGGLDVELDGSGYDGPTAMDGYGGDFALVGEFIGGGEDICGCISV